MFRGEVLESGGILSTCDAVESVTLGSLQALTVVLKASRLQYACFRGLRDDCKACSECEHCGHKRLGAKKVDLQVDVLICACASTPSESV